MADIFDEFRKFRERIFKEFLEEFEDINLEELEREGWKVKKIEGPGVSGFIATYSSEARPRIVEEKPATAEEPLDVMYDVFYEDSEVKVYVDLPGYKTENISVSASENWILIETPDFKKEISLKVKIDPSSVKTKYKNGVLQIKLKKL
ncbi:MAG: Hsp20/alpha crystallin family protein [Thermoproteales archaeon]|nr:Hsp20/alpha crystallin family protein [Thermoproteales archaeon]